MTPKAQAKKLKKKKKCHKFFWLVKIHKFSNIYIYIYIYIYYTCYIYGYMYVYKSSPTTLDKSLRKNNNIKKRKRNWKTN